MSYQRLIRRNTSEESIKGLYFRTKHHKVLKARKHKAKSKRALRRRQKPQPEADSRDCDRSTSQTSLHKLSFINPKLEVTRRAEAMYLKSVRKTQIASQSLTKKLGSRPYFRKGICSPARSYTGIFYDKKMKMKKGGSVEKFAYFESKISLKEPTGGVVSAVDRQSFHKLSKGSSEAYLNVVQKQNLPGRKDLMYSDIMKPEQIGRRTNSYTRPRGLINK